MAYKSKKKVVARLYKLLGECRCCVCKKPMTKEWYQWLFHQSFKPSAMHGAVYTLVKQARADGSFHGVLKLTRKRIDLTIDHRKPVSKGGTNALTNLGFAHRRCNLEKGNSFSEEDE